MSILNRRVSRPGGSAIQDPPAINLAIRRVSQPYAPQGIPDPEASLLNRRVYQDFATPDPPVLPIPARQDSQVRSNEEYNPGPQVVSAENMEEQHAWKESRDPPAKDVKYGSFSVTEEAYEADDEFPVRPIKEKTPTNMRNWRRQQNKVLWTRGGGLRTCGRFFCCTIMIALLLILSIILSMVLWVRPPSFNYSGVALNNTEPVNAGEDTLYIDLDTNISINNPNYFSVDLTDFLVDVSYPINNTFIGSAHTSNVDFRSDRMTNFTLPINIALNLTEAQEIIEIVVDIAKKCGFFGSSYAGNIDVTAKATVGVKIFGISVKPTITKSISFGCPFTEAKFAALLQKTGINITVLHEILGGLEADLTRRDHGFNGYRLPI